MSDMPSTDDFKEVMSPGPSPEGVRLSDWNEESPGEDELGRAQPNYPVDHRDRQDLPDSGMPDNTTYYSQD